MGMTGTSVAFLPAEQRTELLAPDGYLDRLNGVSRSGEVESANNHPTMSTFFLRLVTTKGISECLQIQTRQ